MLKTLQLKMAGDAVVPPRPKFQKIISAFIGGSAGIGLLVLLTKFYGASLLMAPFGATCVLLFAAPDVPLAQPRNVIGGHLVATIVGLLFVHFLPDINAIETGAAVGLAIALMQATRTVHPPAGADPLVVIALGAATPWSFLVTPVLAGSLILVMIALVVNNVGPGARWPRYWV